MPLRRPDHDTTGIRGFSQPARQGAPLLKVLRRCRSIENVHDRVMDTAFHKDDSRICTGQAVHYMVILKRIAYNTRRSG